MFSEYTATWETLTGDIRRGEGTVNHLISTHNYSFFFPRKRLQLNIKDGNTLPKKLCLSRKGTVQGISTSTQITVHTLTHTDTNAPIRLKSIIHQFFHHSFDHSTRAPTHTHTIRLSTPEVVLSHVFNMWPFFSLHHRQLNLQHTVCRMG